MNRIIKILIISEFFIYTGFGLISPIFAIFLKEDLAGGSIAAAGAAATIYLFSKSLLQIFVAKFTDGDRGNRRELYTMYIGTLFLIFVPLLYIMANDISQVYIIQVFYGMGAALVYPGWVVIFTRSIDYNKEGYEWSLYDTITGLGGAVAAALGGIIAQIYGFNTLFILVSAIALVGAILLFPIFKAELIRK